MLLNNTFGSGPSGDMKSRMDTAFGQIRSGNIDFAKKLFEDFLTDGSLELKYRFEIEIQLDLFSVCYPATRVSGCKKLRAFINKGKYERDTLLNALNHWEPYCFKPKYYLGLAFYDENISPTSTITELGRDFIVDCARGNFSPAFCLAGNIQVEDRKAEVDGLMFWKLALPNPDAKSKLDSAASDPILSKHLDAAESKKDAFKRSFAIKPFAPLSTTSATPAIPPPPPPFPKKEEE